MSLPTFDASTLVAITGGDLLRSGPPGSVSADVTAAGPGAWFVALAGEGFDDHLNVPAVVAQGVAGVIVTRRMGDLPCGQLVVDDTWAALRALGHAARRRFAGPVVALTGSVGKTTTRVLTALALEASGEVHQTAGNTNHEPGVPLTLLSCPSTAWAQVLEMGAGHPGDIERLASTVAPDVRVVTSIGRAHAASLGDEAGVAAEKGALFATARPGDTVVVPLDDHRVAGLPVPHGVRRVRVGRGGDVALLEAVPDGPWSMRMRFATPEGEVHARAPAIAPFIASNAAIALAVSWACEVEIAAAAAGFERYAPVGRRLQRHVLPSGAEVLDDTFNASPASVRAALDVLASRPGRRIAVLGEMAELGPCTAPVHAELAAHAVASGVDEVLLVGSRWPTLEGARRVADVDAALGWLAGALSAGDTVLVKGSRAARMERVVDGLLSGV